MVGGVQEKGARNAHRTVFDSKDSKSYDTVPRFVVGLYFCFMAPGPWALL